MAPALKPRLRVCRLLPELDFGGVESRVTLQASLHDRSAIDLRVCGFHKPGAAAAKIREAGVAVDTLDASPAVRNPKATIALARYLRRTRPDVLHASITEANFHALAAAKLAGVPIVIAEETGMSVHRLLGRMGFRLLYRAASTVVGVTEAVCDCVRDVYWAPRERVQLIYNCASPEYFPSARHEPDPGVPPHLLAVGRLTPVKNHEFLLRAFAGVVKRRPDARLTIVGDGPLAEATAALVRQLQLNAQVELCGYRNDVRDLLTKSRGFLLPSLSEGCSISLIEAMATGTPALGSNVPGILEVLGDDLGAKWTAPSSDEAAWTRLICALLELSPDAWRSMALTAQARAYELFSPSAYVQRVEALYRRLALPHAN